MPDNLKQKGISSFLWDIIGKFANSGMGFIITIFLARLLEPSEFGLIAIVLVFLGFISVFFDAGLSAALIQRKRVLPIHYSSVFYFNIIIALILGLLVFISAKSIAEFYNNNELIVILQVMSISFLLGAFSSVQKVQLQRKLNYKILSKITILSTVISGVIGILFAYNGAGVWSLIIQNISFGIMTNILLWKISNWRPSYLFSIKALKNLWSFGFHIFLVSLINSIFGRIDVIIAGKLISPSVLGFYDRAKHLNQMIYSYSAGSLMAVLFPILSKIQKDLERFQKIFIKIYNILSFYIFWFIGLSYIISEELILLLYSEKWLTSVIFFKIIILSTFAHIYGSLLTNILVSRGKSKIYLHIDICKKILMTINLFIGFSYGLEGFLYGSIIVAIMTFIIDLYFATRELNLVFMPFLKTTIIHIIIALFSAVFVLYISLFVEFHFFVILLIKFFLFSIIYLCFSYLFKSQGLSIIAEEIMKLWLRRKSEYK